MKVGTKIVLGMAAAAALVVAAGPLGADPRRVGTDMWTPLHADQKIEVLHKMALDAEKRADDLAAKNAAFEKRIADLETRVANHDKAFQYRCTTLASVGSMKTSTGFDNLMMCMEYPPRAAP